MALLTHLRLANLHEPDVSRQSWDPKKSEGRGFSHGRVLQLPGKVLHQVDRGPAQLLGENLITTDLVTSSDASPGWCPGPPRCRLSSPSSPSLSSPWDTRSSCSRQSSRSGEINVVIILRHVANYPINDPGPGCYNPNASPVCPRAHAPRPRDTLHTCHQLTPGEIL